MAGLIREDIEVGAVEIAPGYRLRLVWAWHIVEQERYLRVDQQYRGSRGEWETGAFPSWRLRREVVPDVAEALYAADEAVPDE